MDKAANIDHTLRTSMIDDALRDSPSEAVTVSAVLPVTYHEDFAGISDTCKIHNGSFSEVGTMEDDNTSPKESPTRKDNSIEVPERMRPGLELINGVFAKYPSEVLAVSTTSCDTQREDCKIRIATISKSGKMEEENTSPKESATKKENLIDVLGRTRLGTEHITACDFCYKTEETIETVKEFINTENKGYTSSYNVQHIQECQIFTPSLPKRVNIDRRTDENQKEMEQSQWYLSEANTEISAALTENDKYFITVAPRVNICASSIETDTISTSHMQKVDTCSVAIETDNISTSSMQTVDTCSVLIETDKISTSSMQTVDTCSVAIETDTISISSMQKVDTCSIANETDKTSISPMPKVDTCSVAIETDTISTTPRQKVDICAAAIETDNSSTKSTRKVNIPAHLAGDCSDINIQKNEIQDCSHMKISEISPNISETNTTPILENFSNVLDIGCPHTFGSNYQPKEANTFVNCVNEASSDYTLEDALFLVTSYISELERVASNIERILQSDSPECKMNKKQRSIHKVSNSHIEFEGFKETMGDNPEIIVGNINKELSDPLGDEAPTASVQIVDGNEDYVSRGEDFYNRIEECIAENMSSMHGEVPVLCTESSEGAYSGLRCDQTSSRVASNSDTRACGSDLPPHNVNNNNTCYLSTNIDNNSKTVLFRDNANAKYPLLSKIRKMRIILFPVYTDMRDVEGHGHYNNMIAITRFENEDNIYENTNNNGNTIRLAPRNIAVSSEPGSSAITQNSAEQTSLKIRNRRLKNKSTTKGNDLLVFEGSKIYSIAQEAPNCEEIVGPFVSDVGYTKHGGSGKSQLGQELSTVSSMRGCQSVNQLLESNDGLPAQCEQLEENSNSVEERQICNFGTNYEKIPHCLSLPCGEKVHSEPNTYLNSNLDKANQISCSESKPNYSPNMVDDTFEMLTVDTPSKGECSNIFHECELEPVRNPAEQRQQNAKRSRNTRRSRNRTYLDNQRQYRKEKLIDEHPLLDIVTSRQDGGMSTKRKTELGGSSLPVSCKHCCQSSAGLTMDNRWASALGSNENSSADINKIEYQRKRNFPIRIRTVSKQNPKDAYIPARTRRLTVESPAENLLVQTSYDRPNPKQKESVISIEVANRRNVLYLGAEQDYIDTDGTRRLVCETECLSSKDPKTKHLVIENKVSNVSYGNINSASEETKKRWENGISVASEKITRGTRHELLHIAKNTSDKSAKWYGAGCARMIGDFVVIGTSKSIRSVVNMVQNQMKYSITTGGSNEAVNLPEAGDAVGNAPRKAVARDQSRGGEIGDHLTLAVTDGSFSNCNNNNVCLPGRGVGGNHKQILNNKVKESVYSGNHGDMASCMGRTWYCPNILEPCIDKTWHCPYITESCMDRTWHCPYITESCMDGTWRCPYITEPCIYRTRCCTNTMVSCLTRTPCCTLIIPPCANIARSCTHKLKDSHTFVTQTNLILRSHADINANKIAIALIYQFVYETVRIISCRLCFLPVSSALEKTSSEPNRNNSSDRESNEWWEVNKRAPRLTNEASTEATDRNPNDLVFIQDCERKMSCPSCAGKNQMAYQNNHQKFGELMTQVEATDINPDAESQTFAISQLPIESVLSVRNSTGRMSLIEDENTVMKNKQATYRTCRKKCSSCSQLILFNGESENHEFETQVEATDINPSNITQTGKSLSRIGPSQVEATDIKPSNITRTGKSLVRIGPSQVEATDIKPSNLTQTGKSLIRIGPSQVEATDINPSNITRTGKSLVRIGSVSTSQGETQNYLRAELSETNLFSRSQIDSKPARSFASIREERGSLSIRRESAYAVVSVPSLPIIWQSFTMDQSPGDESNHEYIHQETESADENSDGVDTREEHCGLEIQEAQLIWQNNGFVVQEPSESRKVSRISMYGQHMSELEFFMPKPEVSNHHDQDAQSRANSTNYVRSTVDHESGGHSVGSIPTSRMSLTVLDPAPVYDFTFTKDQWHPRYRHPILKENINLEKNGEEDSQSSLESETTAREEKEPSTIVEGKSQRSEDHTVLPRSKDSPHRRYIIY